MTTDTTTIVHPWLVVIERGRADVAAGRMSEQDEYIAQLETDDADMLRQLEQQDGPSLAK